MIKLLVVDDEPGICELMKSYFERSNFSVFVANTGKEIVAITKQENPEIMLLDRRLPDGDGLDYLEEIRKFNSAIKVIVVSAYDLNAQDKKRLQYLNVLRYMQKPIRIDDLDKIVKQISS